MPSIFTDSKPAAMSAAVSLGGASAMTTALVNSSGSRANGLSVFIMTVTDKGSMDTVLAYAFATGWWRQKITKTASFCIRPVFLV